MSEFIGSRISLISKSDIRYVGTLHEINSENSTVALEQVKSYGTEGRRGNPAEELAGSDSVYDYIVFRGSDVKDLRIEEAPKEAQPPPPPQVPNDPAILGSSSRPDAPHPQHPYQQQQQQQQQQGPPYGQQQFNGGFTGQRFGGPPGYQGGGPPGPPAPPPNGYPGYPPMPYGPPPPGYYGPPGHGMPPPQGPFSPSQQMPFGAPGPHQQGGQIPPQQKAAGPPTIHPDSMPQEKETPDSLPKPATKQKPAAGDGGAATATKGAPRPPIESKPDTAAAIAAPKPPTAGGPGGKKGKIVPAMPLAGGLASSTEGGRASQAAAKLQYQNATQAATAAVAAAMAKLPPASGAGGAKGPPPEADEALARAVQDMRVDQRTRNGTHGEHGGQGRGRGGRRGGREAAKGVEVPKTDFDFESANAKFNKQDAVKGDGEATADGGTDGAGEISIPAAAPMYSKSSFFDNISSEAKDREEAVEGSRRPTGNDFRTQERQRNMETFGMGSVDNRFSGYRGRGRGGRGGGQRGRGGFRGGRGALDTAS